VSDKIIPVALRVWLGFLFLFLLIGYSPVASVVFGAVGGFAAGMVSAWWTTPGGVPATTDMPEPLRRLGSQIKGTPSRLPFMKLFTRRNRRYSRSRR